MRWPLIATLGLSLVAHGAVAAVFFVPRLDASPAPPEPLPDPAPQNAGETFELPAPESAEIPLANASPSPDTNAPPAPVDFPDAPARPSPPANAKSAARPSHEGRPSAGHTRPSTTESAAGSSASASLFGAVGERSATELARAFTLDFPQAASGDPLWQRAPLGPAGQATVVMTIDDEGHLVETRILGTPSAPLAAGIRRTIALIKGRPFVARGKITKLHLAVSVSEDTVHDGLHGEVFAIGHAFAAGEGSGFFALDIGRRIDLRVRQEQ